jgi:hypothetical protein
VFTYRQLARGQGEPRGFSWVRSLKKSVTVVAVAGAVLLTASGAWAGARPLTAVTGTRADLTAVTAIPGTSGAWAVGEKCPKEPEGCTPGSDEILRESASGWSEGPAPDPGGQASLVAVSADSATDAWAVGSYFGGEKNLYLHWTGAAWKQVGGPDNSTLTGVAAISPTDALAVGYYTSSTGATVTLALHWNGKTWAKVATPNPGGAGDDELLGVTAVSATDAWAVGYLLTGAAGLQTLILHWNGQAWSQSTAPRATTDGTRLSAVAAGSGTDVWAVGQYNTASDWEHPLILHWNGQAWSEQKLPRFGQNQYELDGVAATASSVWAVGLGPCVGPSINCPSKTLTMHLTSSGWHVATSVSVSDTVDQNVLAGVAVTSGSNAWAVGEYFPAAESEPVFAMLQHWNGAHWTTQ